MSVAECFIVDPHTGQVVCGLSPKNC